jgi:hypothetical protein
METLLPPNLPDAPEQEPESRGAKFLRNPLVVGLAILAALATAFQLAGVISMLLAKIVLAAGIWVFITVEVWCSKWIKRAGLYTTSIVLLTSCMSGSVAVLAAVMISALRIEQQAASNKVMPSSDTSPSTVAHDSGNHAPPIPYRPPGNDLTISFKVSPVLTQARRDRMIAEITAFYEFLVRIGFNPPRTVPIIGTAPHHTGLAFSRYSCTNSELDTTLPYSETTIGEVDIDNPECIRQVYGAFVFMSLLRTCGEYSSPVLVFSDYFSTIYDGKHSLPDRLGWRTALLDLRKSYGKELIDAAMLSTYKTWHPLNKGEDSKDQDSFFARRFIYGLFFIDDQHRHVEPITKFLRERGLYRE